MVVPTGVICLEHNTWDQLEKFPKFSNLADFHEVVCAGEGWWKVVDFLNGDNYKLRELEDKVKYVGFK
jgi:hypothetical protein